MALVSPLPLVLTKETVRVRVHLDEAIYNRGDELKAHILQTGEKEMAYLLLKKLQFPSQ